MSQPTIQLRTDAAAFAQEQNTFRRSEDRELRKMRRKNSFFSPRNLLGMLIGVKDISAEYLIYLLLMIVLSPFLMFGVARCLEILGVMVPVAVTIALSAALPLAMLGLFMAVSVDEKMAAKRKTVAATRRAAELLDRNARPVLTAEHVALRERLDELFLSGRVEMPMSECVDNADRVFALMLEDFSAAHEVMRIVESRGLYSADDVRAVMYETRQVMKPLLEGAL